MSKSNPLVGLISYGDSDESEDEVSSNPVQRIQPPSNPGVVAHEPTAGVHPAPIPHCAWSACYDEGSGFTYYWNQHTNAVTWEAPQEYLMALKLAQHQLHASGSAEVSAEEWQLYQQALADKQKPCSKTKAKSAKPSEHTGQRNGAKRKVGSDDENEKIELIDSYHNSDSESNDEESPVKSVPPAIVKPVSLKNPHKKQKTKPPVEYGPSLPVNQNYTVPIGPELPPGMMVESEPKLPEVAKEEKVIKTAKTESEDSQDESALFKRLKDKAKLLEKLGGEIPSELQMMIQDEPKSSPKVVEDSSRDSKLDIDDLLSEIEQNELPRIKSKKNEILGEEFSNSGKSTPAGSPPREYKPLFPSSKAIEEAPLPPLPSDSAENGLDKTAAEPEKKPVNIYLGNSEVKENRKKLRIDNSILPDRKKSEVPAYTTKYSQFIEGFSGERTGLGFKEEEGSHSPKAASTVSYGNGLTFTKGEVLNEEKKDEDLDEMSELLEAKLKFLNEVQPCTVGPAQTMLIQLQTLVAAFRSGALAGAYWRRWVAAGELSLRALERRAAPPGWTCAFQRSEGRYRYRRESDGLTQWEYPAAAHCDMEICTTPPPEEPKPAVRQEPAPQPAPPPLPPMPPPAPSPPSPPVWHDPPPPGCDDPPPLPPEPKKEIGDELLSFYSDIAELEGAAAPRPPAPPAAIAAPPAAPAAAPAPPRDAGKDKDTKVVKKKSKVKISASIGLKHKTVSNMVAKWQQVADEIHSD